MNEFRNHLATRTRLDELRVSEIGRLDRLAPAIAPEEISRASAAFASAMGKGGEAEVAPPPAEPSAPDDSSQTDAKEARFLSALQAMVGGAELTEDSVRSAIASLSPAQRQQLLAEGQDLKRDLLTNQERKEDRNLYFKEVNNSADQAGLPVDKDGAFLAKKVRATKSHEKKPQPS